MSAGTFNLRTASGQWSQRRPRPEQPRWPRAAGLGVLVAAGLAVWWPVLGDSLLGVAPAVAVAMVLVAGRGRLLFGLITLVVWAPLSLVLAGLPLSVLKPSAIGSTVRELGNGWHAVGVSNHQLVDTNPWAVAAALLAFGSCWLIAGIVATQTGRASSVLAFIQSTVPFGAASVLSQSSDAAWHGAAVLAAAMLWLYRGRIGAALVATGLIAAVAVLGAQSFGPQDRWLAFGGPVKPNFTELETNQTYGPLEDRRTGQTMLTITSSQPALWRMQVLEQFDGRGFNVSRRMHDPLPQPAARSIQTTVKVGALRNRLVVSAGQVSSVMAKGDVRNVLGEGTELTPGPATGSTYVVQSEVVDATVAQLAKVQIPSDTKYDRYTRFFAPPPSPIPRPAAALADNLPPGYAGTPLAGVLTLARDLSRGEPSQLAVVRRVMAYLNDPDRFTYTTDVGPGGDQPLADFLLKTHRGYCQHFAGAAALLLRLAGIPTRVVSGFATGTAQGDNTYKVVDSDAHAWIEVYFPGYGWVPFNPTPKAADAVVASSLDLLAPPPGRFSAVQGAATPIVLGLMLLGAGGFFLLRSRRRADPEPRAVAQLGELLARLIPGPVPAGATLARLQPQFAAIGPSVADLATRVERARFAGSDRVRLKRPRRELWQALRRDTGWRRATWLVLTRARGSG